MATSEPPTPRPPRLPRPAPPPSAPIPGRGQWILTWFGSAKNIAGCTCALAGAGASAAGLVDWPFWPPVVAALYAIGALVAPPRRAAVAGGGIDVDDLRATVEAQYRALIDRAPDDRALVAAAEEVIGALRQVLDTPHLLRPGSPETFAVERTVADYLPTAVETYLGLPRAYAETHRLPDGRTPRDVLLATLALLAGGMREVTEAAARGDTAQLLAHSRFLTDRFGPTELTLPDPARPDLARPDLPRIPGPPSP